MQSKGKPKKTRARDVRLVDLERFLAVGEAIVSGRRSIDEIVEGLSKKGEAEARSTIGHLLTRLEGHYGFRIINRIPGVGMVGLTDEGKELLKRSRVAVQLLSDAGAFSDDPDSVIRIGISHFLEITVLPDVIDDFYSRLAKRKSKGWQRFAIINIDDLYHGLQLLRLGQLDCVIDTCPSKPSYPDIESEGVDIPFQHMVIVPRQRTDASNLLERDGKTVDIADLIEFPLAMSELRKITESFPRPTKPVPRVFTETTAAVLRYTRQGYLGVCLNWWRLLCLPNPIQMIRQKAVTDEFAILFLDEKKYPQFKTASRVEIMVLSAVDKPKALALFTKCFVEQLRKIPTELIAPGKA